mgnify:CR=1 FL=1
MANTTISALSSASTPLIGTEVLPIDQNGITKKVTIANITAGRSITAENITAGGSIYSGANITASNQLISNSRLIIGSIGSQGGFGYGSAAGISVASQDDGDVLTLLNATGGLYSGLSISVYDNGRVAFWLGNGVDSGLQAFNLSYDSGTHSLARMFIGDVTTSATATLHIKAGTAASGTAPLKLSSGTNLTTAEAGAVEYNGTALLFTGTATVGAVTGSGRGVVLAPMMVRLNSSRNKATNDTNLEAVFDPANDSLDLAANTLYYFKGLYRIVTSVTTSSCVPQIGFIFSNAQQTISYKYSSFILVGYPTSTLSNYTSVATVQPLITSGNTSATTYCVEFEGWFKSNATTGGTFTPAFTQSVAGTSVSPTVASDSWIRVQPMSSNPSATLIAGNWS